MKKYILAIFLTLSALTASAKAPGLNVEKLFDGTYNSDPSVTIILTQSQDKFFRGFTVADNEAIVKKVTELFEKDLPRATSSQVIKNNGTEYRSMTLVNNGENIYIGVSYNDDNGCYLFIAGAPAAF